MKKIISAIMSATIALSSFAALAVTANAEDTWAPTATSYTADFTKADELSSWYKGTGTTTATVSGGCASLKTSAWSQYFLPIAKTENFVLESNITHTTGKDGVFQVFFGADAASTTAVDKNVMWFQLGGTKGMRGTFVNGKGTSIDSSIDGAFQWNITPYTYDTTKTSSLNQNFDLKVVVYNKKVAAWVDDQLIYSYTLEDTYAGGYIGIGGRYSTVVLNDLTVRPAAATDMVLAESFNEADLTNCNFNELTSIDYLSADQWGTATLKKYGNTMTWIDKNKSVVGDHAYNAGFTFGSTNNGATRYFSPMFGITDNEDGTMSGWAVYVKINGEIVIGKVSITAAGGVTVATKKTFGNTATRSYFPNKLGKIGDTEVLALDTMWEYRHVLNNGTLYIYLDDVLIGSYANDDLKSLSGYTGFFVNGMASSLNYFGVRGVETADLNRVNQVKITDENGTALANKVVRLYNADNVLYGTTYADSKGMFDLDMGHNQTYTIKAYNTDGTLVAETDEAVTYTANGSTNTFALTKLTPSAASDITVVEAYEDGQELEDGRVVDGAASLLEFTVNANDYAVSKVHVTATTTEETQTMENTIVASGSAVFGIIVNGLAVAQEAASSLFTVTVE